MKKWLLIAIIMSIPFCQAGGTKEKMENIHVISDEILIEDNVVNEKIVFLNTGKSNYSGEIYIWCCGNYGNFNFDEIEGIFRVENNNFTLNLSEYDFSLAHNQNFTVNLTYNIGKRFEKKIIYSTDEIEIMVFGNKMLKGNISFENKGGYYYSKINPKLNDKIWIEFVNEEKYNLSFIGGIIAIIIGVFILLMALRKIGRI